MLFVNIWSRIRPSTTKSKSRFKWKKAYNKLKSKRLKATVMQAKGIVKSVKWMLKDDSSLEEEDDAVSPPEVLNTIEVD